jgi:hypothetical protein
MRFLIYISLIIAAIRYVKKARNIVANLGMRLDDVAYRDESVGIFVAFNSPIDVRLKDVKLTILDNSGKKSATSKKVSLNVISGAHKYFIPFESVGFATLNLLFGLITSGKFRGTVRYQFSVYNIPIKGNYEHIK